MNYWCNTCGCYKGAQGADECAVDGHAIVPAKDREVKIASHQSTEMKVPSAHSARLEIIKMLGYGPSSISSPEWIVAKVEAERNAFRAEIADLKKALEAKQPDEKPFTPEELDLLKNSAFGKVASDPYPKPKPKPKEEWTPKVGDRVWVSGKTWSMPGTITGWAKDDASVPWIKTDDGRQWDARDLGSVRKAKEEDRWDPT